MKERLSLLADGEFEAQQRQEVLRAIASMGFTLREIPPVAYDELVIADYETIYTFDEIVSPDQYMGKEHFRQFKDTYLPGVSRNTAGWLFNIFIDPREYATMSADDEHYDPSEFGIVLKSRSELGLPDLADKYKTPQNPQRTLDQSLMVEVGSVVEFLDQMLSGNLKYFRQIGPNRTYFCLSLFETLKLHLGADYNS